VSHDLLMKGFSREVVNRIQSLRKSSDLQLTDRIRVEYNARGDLNNAIELHESLICRETLAVQLDLAEQPSGSFVETFEVGEGQLILAITVVSAA